MHILLDLFGHIADGAAVAHRNKNAHNDLLAVQFNTDALAGHFFTAHQADTADTAGDDYFSTARLSRKQARDTAISMLEEAKGEENASEEVANEASETLQVLAGYTVAETQIENLVVAKGYADCVAFMGADSISVVVSAPDGLEAEDVAKIKDIVIAETSYTPGQIKIMEAGTSGAK